MPCTVSADIPKPCNMAGATANYFQGVDNCWKGMFPRSRFPRKIRWGNKIDWSAGINFELISPDN